MAAPRVAVTLPVYNGAATLKRALESIQAQTFTDFRVLMIDNASTDNTGAICRQFANSDQRFEYYRNYKNMGIGFSFDRGLYLGLDSDFMIYLGRDDYWHPQYLERCVNALDANPKAVLAYTHVNFLDSEGVFKGIYKDEWDLTSPDPATRYLHIIGEMGLINCLYGLIRSETWANHAYWLHEYSSAAGDNVIAAGMALEGQFIQIAEPLFYRTTNPYEKEDMATRVRRLKAMGAWGLERKPNAGIKGETSHPVHFGFVMFIHVHLRLLNQYARLFDYATRDNLYKLTVQTLLTRYGFRIKEETELAIDLIGKGLLHRRDFFEPELDIPAQGLYKSLDYSAITHYLAAFEEASGLIGSLKIARFHYTRALLLLMLGRKNEALVMLDMELAENPTCREALELKAKLK